MRDGYVAHVRILVTGWFSFVDGEATAGDVLSLEAVRSALADLPYDVAWSPVFRPGALTLDDAAPQTYSHLVFVCGPLHGPQLRRLHERYAACRRIAVGVSVIDPRDPAVTGFDVVLPRDAPDAAPRRDLAALPAHAPVPVAGVVLAPGQAEYGSERRHDEVHDRLTSWLARRDCARLVLDTRLDHDDWRCFGTPDQLLSVVGRLDVVVTTRLHGLVTALRCGVPALAVDPVRRGAKVSAQARTWRWPATLTAEEMTEDTLDRWWQWCLGTEGRHAAARASRDTDDALLGDLRTALGAPSS
ncbi:polysaccharide pyruvyl transferase [Actinoallomurus iriomotensis]|uniref:Polysaccharide pyruvyl transferase n=1 Tax=Actinoallomurus iriomotensis TaxID=478107 RepID=A0A9W6VQH2_9ACTN|nr:polysaccharide pyruvyl transferase [Actinoallomurus iriomotensis]